MASDFQSDPNLRLKICYNWGKLTIFKSWANGLNLMRYLESVTNGNPLLNLWIHVNHFRFFKTLRPKLEFDQTSNAIFGISDPEKHSVSILCSITFSIKFRSWCLQFPLREGGERGERGGRETERDRKRRRDRRREREREKISSATIKRNLETLNTQLLQFIDLTSGTKNYQGTPFEKKKKEKKLYTEGESSFTAISKITNSYRKKKTLWKWYMGTYTEENI